MKRGTIIALAVAAGFPILAGAQLKAPTNISVPTASSIIRSITLRDVLGLQGSRITQEAAFSGDSCQPAGCIVARAATGSPAALTVHFGDGSVRAPILQTGLVIAHNVQHSLNVSLNGAEILGLLCNGMGSLKAVPNFSALGASTGAFAWELRDGGKVVTSGYASGGGEGIVIDMGHDAGAMALAISDHGVLSLMHGTHTLTITPQAKDIGAKTGGYLKFEDLGLRVGGVSEFGVVNAALRSGVQPPGI